MKKVALFLFLFVFDSCLLSTAFAQTQLVTNGGFEFLNAGEWQFQGSFSPAPIVTNPTRARSGSSYLLMGAVAFTNQYVWQTFTIPSNTIKGQLSFWYNVYSLSGPNQFLYAVIATNGLIADAFPVAGIIGNPQTADPAEDSAHYHPVVFNDLTQFAGKTVQLVFYTSMGQSGFSTRFNIDDVSLLVETTADLAPNDNFTNRTMIDSSITSTNAAAELTFATTEPGEPHHGGISGGRSVWWSFTPPTNGILQLNAFSTNFNNVMAVYTGDALNDLTLVRSVNSSDTSDAVSRIRLPVSSATEYQIVVDAATGSTGTVNFQFGFLVDTNPPVVTITSPLQGQKVTNSTVTVHGTATDNLGVANVQYRLENSAGTNDYLEATGTNSWSGTLLNLIPGTNTVRAIAYDTNGNLSASTTRSFSYVIVSPLTLSITGVGTLSPNYSNASLEIGRTYSITARPANGYVFSNWTGDVTSKSPTLAFMMQSNLVLQANFILNPFPTGKGTYAGLFSPADQVSYTNSGFFSASVTTSGKFTSKLQLAGKTYSLPGQFAVDGSFSNNVRRLNLTPLSVQLEIDLSGGDVITGTVSDGNWTADLLANRATFSRTSPPPYPGQKFTFVLPGSNDSSTAPGGHGFGSGMIDPAGNITLATTLGDGTKISERIFLSKEGTWPLFAMPYGGKGLVFGWMTIDTNQAAGDFGGPIEWIKLPQRGRYYTNGFDFSTDAVGSFYTFSNGLPVVSWTNGTIILSEGNLPDSITNTFTIGANNKISGTDMSLTFVPSSGLFRGSVKNVATGKMIQVNGAVLQKQDDGFGAFLGTNETGQVFMGPQQ